MKGAPETNENGHLQRCWGQGAPWSSATVAPAEDANIRAHEADVTARPVPNGLLVDSEKYTGDPNS